MEFVFGALGKGKKREKNDWAKMEKSERGERRRSDDGEMRKEAYL